MAFKPRSRIMTIRLTEDQYVEFGKVADMEDMKPATYAHALVLKEIKKDRNQSGPRITEHRSSTA
jgi:hypothetical protein